MALIAIVTIRFIDYLVKWNKLTRAMFSSWWREKMDYIPGQSYLPTDRNCDVLPLSLDDLLNYTTLMLKFCTNKRIWASLIKGMFVFRGGEGCVLPQKRV
jgi:hypothetical protein